MSDLSTLVEALQRELAVPGTFDVQFPDTTEDDLAASLADGFAMAQLHGFFPTLVLDLDAGEVDPDLSVAGGSLVVLYSAYSILRAWMRSLLSSVRYKAGPVEYETTRPISLLRDELKYLQGRIDDLVDTARSSARDVYVMDNYSARLCATDHGGFYDYEFRP